MSTPVLPISSLSTLSYTASSPSTLAATASYSNLAVTDSFTLAATAVPTPTDATLSPSSASIPNILVSQSYNGPYISALQLTENFCKAVKAVQSSGLWPLLMSASLPSHTPSIQRNMCECLSPLGQPSAATSVATEAATSSQSPSIGTKTATFILSLLSIAAIESLVLHQWQRYHMHYITAYPVIQPKPTRT